MRGERILYKVYWATFLLAYSVYLLDVFISSILIYHPWVHELNPLDAWIAERSKTLYVIGLWVQLGLVIGVYWFIYWLSSSRFAEESRRLRALTRLALYVLISASVLGFFVHAWAVWVNVETIRQLCF